MKRALAHILAVLGGAAIWTAGCYASGEVEAWDSVIYTEAVLPGLAGLVALLGFWIRERPGALGIAASLGQLIGLVVTRGEDVMWPVDVAILAALAVPLGLSAWLGGALRGVLGGTVRVASGVVRGVARGGARLCSRRRVSVGKAASN